MAASANGLPVILGEALDFYLSLGYYRMQQELFTCQFVPFKRRIYTAHWLRLVLAGLEWGPAQRHLLRRNARFAATVRPFRPRAEYEDLYVRYLQSVVFEAAPTVDEVLLGGAPHNVFNTHVIELRDEGQLVAAGVFDRGERSLAGILNFYDPDYRKHSLGKYLMLLKVEYARQLGLDYYYPGYLIHNFPKFDYKLFPSVAATEVFDSISGLWHPFSWEVVATQSAELFDKCLPDEFRTADSPYGV